MYVCGHVYIYIYIYLYMFVCVYVCVCVYLSLYWTLPTNYINKSKSSNE